MVARKFSCWTLAVGAMFCTETVSCFVLPIRTVPGAFGGNRFDKHPQRLPSKSKGIPVVARYHPSTLLLHLSDAPDNDISPDDQGRDESSDNDGDDNKFNVETARKQLEFLMYNGEGTEIEDNVPTTELTNTFSVKEFLAACRKSLPTKRDIKSSNNDQMAKDLKRQKDAEEQFFQSLLPARPPMSTAERVRREREMQLLQLLEDDDDASEGLWDLWYSEKGPQYKKLLAETDPLLANPDTWDKCEQQLLELIDQSSSTASDDRPGVYFVEAMNRMATLYFLQGRLKDSYALCRLVLHLKPWHFGALSGIVQVSIGLGDREEARFWAERRLPTLLAGSSFPPFTTDANPKNTPRNPRRKEWCALALRDAESLLRISEKNTGTRFGKPEKYYSLKAPKPVDPDHDEEAWQ